MRLFPFALILAAACGHSEPFTGAVNPIDGPFSESTPVRLTFNSGVDSAATLTEDGSGILYLYSPGGGNGDRCAGILPTGGGTQRWQLCDTRATRADSAKSFSAVALGGDGRLLYQQALARRGKAAPDRIILWVADSATPFVRRQLLSLPTNIGGRGISWLTGAEWTGTNEFVANAGILDLPNPCGGCPFDSLVLSRQLVRGTIGPDAATLAIIPGTEDADFMALAEGRTSIVQLRRFTVERLPVSGGQPTTIGVIPQSGRVSGLGCRGTECVSALVVNRYVWEYFDNPQGERDSVEILHQDTHLFRIQLGAGTISLLRVELDKLWAGPVLLPSGGDVILQSSEPNASDLYLFKRLLP